MKKYYEAYEERYKQIHAYDLQWASDHPSKIVLETIQKYQLSKATPILEIGCGEGRDAACLLKADYQLTASDISLEAISYCQKKYPEYANHFIQLDAVKGHHENNMILFMRLPSFIC